MSQIAPGENDFRYPPPIPRDNRDASGDSDPRITREVPAPAPVTPPHVQGNLPGGTDTPYPPSDPPHRSDPPYPSVELSYRTDLPYPNTGPYRRRPDGFHGGTGHVRPGQRAHRRPSSQAISRRPTRAGTPPVRRQTNSGGTIAKGIFAGLGIIIVVGASVWLFNQRGALTGDETATDEAAVVAEDSEPDIEPDIEPEAPSTTALLQPAALPDLAEPGLVVYEMKLMDAYTGTGMTGSAKLFVNAVTGEVCHAFGVTALTGQYLVFINQGAFPQEGPSVINLGATENAVSQCVSVPTSDLARVMTNPEEFYVSSVDLNGEILLRSQFSEASVPVDNRDDATLAEQEMLANSGEMTDSTVGRFFNNDSDGAYIEIDGRTVTFRGAVPTRARADSLLEAFAELAASDVEVVNELEIQAGAPDPSGRVVIGTSLMFESNQAEIVGDDAVLSTLAAVLQINPAWTATVTGHTDNVGLRAYNIDLSLRRANTVRTLLGRLGVAEDRIKVEGFGPDQPVSGNDTAAGRAENRRIEMTIDS